MQTTVKSFLHLCTGNGDAGQGYRAVAVVVLWCRVKFVTQRDSTPWATISQQPSHIVGVYKYRLSKCSRSHILELVACHLPFLLNLKFKQVARTKVWNAQRYGNHIAIETTTLSTLVTPLAEMNLALTEDSDRRQIVGVDINREDKMQMSHARPPRPW